MPTLPIRGLALAHTLATRDSAANVQMATRQEELIRETISKRDLGDATPKPQRDLSNSRLAQAKILFAEQGSKPRNQVIELFISQLGLTKAGATTYYSRLRGEQVR
jgi:hypothetical protein